MVDKNYNNGNYRTDSTMGDGKIWISSHEKRLLSKSSELTWPDGQNYLPEDYLYDNIKDAFNHYSRIYPIYLIAIFFTFLIISSLPTIGFFEEQIITIPFIDAPIPLTYYLVIAPPMLIGFFCYWQLYLFKTNRLIKYAVDECKSVNNETCNRFQDNNCSLNKMCARHLSRLPPSWVFIYYQSTGYPADIKAFRDRQTSLITNFQRAFLGVFLWWLLPMILLFLAIFVIRQHRPFLSIYMMTMAYIGIPVVAFFWHRQHNLFGTIKRKINPLRAVLIAIFVGCFPMALAVLNSIAFYGKIPYHNSVWDEEKNSWYVLAIRSIVFLDLSKEMRSKKSDFKMENLHNLEKRRLDGANLSSVKLRKANLKGVSLKNAFLKEANLEKANLRKAHAKGADFRGVILEMALLVDSKLVGADFSNAKLHEAKLMGARLDGVNFSEADLSGADLTDSQIVQVIFKDANLQHTKLFSVRYMQPDQIKKANNYQLAYYSRNSLLKLGLPSDNNVRVKSKQFSKYKFNNAVLKNADLFASDLSEANLSNAVLKDANLQCANLKGAVLVNTDFQGANLKAITYTDFEQFSKVKTFYMAMMDVDLRIELEKRYPNLFINPNLSI